jgi:hypothetical protein
LNMLVEMVKRLNGYLSTTPASPTDAEIVCHGEATTGALPTAFGGLTSAPDSSASLSSSSGIDASELVVPIDASDLTVLALTKCSTEGPSRNTCESGSPSVPEMVPTPPSATVDIISVLASTAASEEAVDGDAVTGVVSIPSVDGMHHGTHEEGLAVSLLLKTITLWQSSSTPGPQRRVMRILDEFIFELRPATMSCSVLGSSVSIKLSDDISLYGMLLDAFCMIREWVWLLQVPPRPPDASKSTGALFSVLLPFLPTPDPKPPWLLLGRALVGAYLRCELQKSTTYLNLDAAYTSFLCMVTQRTFRATILIDIPVHGKILRKKELEKSENYASDNLTNVLHVFRYTTNLFCSWQPPAPIPKPPWLLPVHERVPRHKHPMLVLVGALHVFQYNLLQWL